MGPLESCHHLVEIHVTATVATPFRRPSTTTSTGNPLHPYHVMSITPDRIVYVSNLEEDTPFPDSSDAKIARLTFTGDLLAQIIDLVFDITHDKSFKPEELTVQQAVGVFLCISGFRTK